MSDTEAIDEKNEQINSSKSGTQFTHNIGKFLLTTLLLCIIVLGYYGTSGLILYACKLAQSNILPTNKKCFPYEDTKPNIKPVQINIFPTQNDPNPPMSMKMNFPYSEYNASNKILDLFREYKQETQSNFMANYFISMMETIIQFNYATFNFILDAMNANLPETVIVLFGPVIVSIVASLLFIADNLYLIYLWFANMSWFFKTNTNSTNGAETGPPKWESVGVTSPSQYGCAIALVILFAILFFFCFPLLTIMATFSMAWCMLSGITYKAEMNGHTINAGTVIQDVFKYYKVLIMGILCFLITISAFSKLGSMSGVISLVILGFIYFGVIAVDMFQPINKDHLSALTSYNQAIKTCSNKGNGTGTVKGFFSSLFSGNGQKGGQGNILTDLKRLAKKI